MKRLRQELEESESFVVPDDLKQRSAQIESVASKLQTAVDGHKKRQDAKRKEYADLKDAHDAFIQRLDDDLLQLVSTSTDDRKKSVKVLDDMLTSFRNVLALTKFSDVDRESLNKMFQSAANSLDRLLKSDGRMFLNEEGILMEALMNENNIYSSEECPSSFLDLSKDSVCSELTTSTDVTTDTKSKPDGEDPVPDGTARESDLYKIVENIKEILSRRDVSLLVPDADGSMPSPLGEAGTAKICKYTADAVVELENQRQKYDEQQQELRVQWMSKVESQMPKKNQEFNNDDNSMCSRSYLVEQMVAGGLESIQNKGDLGTALRTTLFSALVNEPNFEAHDMQALQQAMQEIDPIMIDYEKRQQKQPPPSSRAKSSRKSIYYLVDSPLLHRGVTGMIDGVVDFISGYYDHIDALLDWIVGDSRSTVGEIMVDAFLRIVRRIPYHDEFAERFKSAGILAGRTRTLLEE